MKEVSSTAENHPDPVPDPDTTLETEHEVEENDMDEAEVEAEVEENDIDEGGEEQEPDHEDGDDGDEDEIEEEDEFDQRTPSPPKKATRKTPRRKRPLMTKGRMVPPIDAPEGGYPGGPSDLSLLPSFGKHIANALWLGQVFN
jgi:hypothetical protein